MGHIWLWGVRRFPGSLLLPWGSDCPLFLGDTRLCVPRDEGLLVAIELRRFGDSHIQMSRAGVTQPQALGSPQILGFRVDLLWCDLLGTGDSCPQSLGDTQLLWFGDSRPLVLGDIEVLGVGDPCLWCPWPILLRRSALVCPLSLGTPLGCPQGSPGGWGSPGACGEGIPPSGMGVRVTPHQGQRCG